MKDWLEHDFAKDPTPLLEALRSDKPLPKHLRDVLIDLLTRYNFKRKRSAARIPSYRVSEPTAKLLAAEWEYKTYDMGKHGREAAIKQLAKSYDITTRTLRDYILGSRGSRRKPRTP